VPVAVVPTDPAWPTTRPADRSPVPPADPAADPATELDRQVEAYLALGVAALHGWDAAALRAAVAPLAAALRAETGPDRDRPVVLPPPRPGAEPTDQVPFVLVLDPGTALVNATAPAMRRGARLGVSVIDDEEMSGYRPLPELDLPSTGPYLLTGIETGTELCGVRPEDALVTVRERGRTPLTIAEGLALVAVRPDMLRPNRCFSLMGSRAANQRVPAVWISERRAKLGWCWDRNPHTWLGAASAAGRFAG
jgi:hypothetical protein